MKKQKEMNHKLCVIEKNFASCDDIHVDDK